MARYLVLYRSSVSSEEMMANATPEQMQAGVDAWMQWATRAGDAIVDLGTPLGPSTRAGGGGTADATIAGYSVLEAESLDAVRALLDGHPHLMSPGDPSVDAHEVMPMPGA
jgi:hypothetical protein